MKKRKGLRAVINIMTIIDVFTLAFLLFTIFLWENIETELRYIAMGVLVLVNIGIIILRKITKKEKLVPYIIYMLILLIFIGAQGFVGYYIYSYYSVIDNINKNELVYASNVIVYKTSEIKSTEDLNKKEIGIVVEEGSIDGYIIPMEIIKEFNLNSNNTIVEYDTITSLISDLYEKKIDAAIVSSNYTNMFLDSEDYKDIATDTKTIYSKEKVLTKEEIAEISGEEITSVNSSNTINEPFTILIMGVDSTLETLSSSATGNGDSLMLITFNPKTLNATILSIPRDSYVYVPCVYGGSDQKITHASWGGTSCMIRAIEGFTGMKINYYVKINFKGVVKLVDALGGVDVDVPTDLCTDNSNRNSQVCLKAGYQTLNGEQALAFARNRYAFATGDFQRGLNQQVVVQAMLNKLQTIKSANHLLEILDVVSNSMDTNFTTKQILSFYDIAKNLFETSTTDSIITMQQLYLSGSGQMIYDERSTLVLYNYILNKCGLKQVLTVMNQNLSDTSNVSMTKTFNFDIEKPFSMSIIGQNPSCGTTTYTLLPSVVGKTKTSAVSSLEGYGLTVTVEYKEITDGSYANDIVISQSLPVSKRIDKITDKKITIVVAKVEEVVVVPEEPQEPEVTPTCSDTTYTTQEECETNGGTWN